MTMVFTQMLPMSFADSISGAETEAAAAADEDTGEAADDSEAAADTDSEAAATADADSTEAADDSAELQEGTDEGTDEGTGEEEPTVDYNPGISWYLNDKTASTFEISTAEQLFGLAQLVNGTAVEKTSAEDAGTKVQTNFGGKTVKLTADIDLGNEPWSPIGQGTSYCFRGTFDGQGHTI